mmetsp:Transcript_92297/g.246839  ORF Transcript_92297/g.246839 Transcript_92297/m.246839 type:complete len:303 (-) Transcript_92297:824-1732(-)
MVHAVPLRVISQGRVRERRSVLAEHRSKILQETGVHIREAANVDGPLSPPSAGAGGGWATAGLAPGRQRATLASGLAGGSGFVLHFRGRPGLAPGVLPRTLLDARVARRTPGCLRPVADVGHAARPAPAPGGGLGRSSWRPAAFSGGLLRVPGVIKRTHGSSRGASLASWFSGCFARGSGRRGLAQVCPIIVCHERISRGLLAALAGFPGSGLSRTGPRSSEACVPLGRVPLLLSRTSHHILYTLKGLWTTLARPADVGVEGATRILLGGPGSGLCRGFRLWSRRPARRRFWPWHTRPTRNV